MTERRTEFSRTYYNADGTCTAELAARPIHYKAADGSFQSISATLTTTDRPGYAAANETNPLRSYLPATATGWVRVEASNAAVAFRPIGAASATASVSADCVTYAGVAENTSLAYMVEPGRLKESILLTAPTASASFAFALTTQNVTPRAAEDGGVQFVGESGKPVMTFDAPWMRDARGRVSYDIGVTVTPASEGYVYALTPDAGWLAAATYPVVVDPTATIYMSGSGNFGYARHDYPTDYGDCGAPGYAYKVGVTGTDQTGAARSVIQFDASGLPLDIDVNYANLTTSCTAVLNSNTQTIEATEYPFLVSEFPRDVVWSNSNYSVLYVGRDAAPLVNGIGKTLTGTGTGNVTFDVTDPLRNWTDRRVLEDSTGSNTFTSLPFQIMLRDTSDYDGATTVSENMRTFTATTMSISVNYTEGWYTFQGNRRRTGRTQYGFGENWIARWHTNLATYDGDVYARTSSGHPFSPGVIAVPNPSDPTSAHPVLYAVVNDQHHARVYRIVDNGTSTTSTYRTFDDFRVHSTPLAIGNRLYIAGNDLDTSGAETNGKVYALDPSNLATTQWSRTMPGRVYSSPVFVPLTSSYTIRRSDQTEYSWGCTNYVLIGCNVVAGSSEFGFMFALSHSNGFHVWGTVDESTGDYIEGLSELMKPTTQSSPTADQQRAYIVDNSCYLNVLNVFDGSPRWADVVIDDTSLSTVSLFDKRIFYGGVGDEYGGYITSWSEVRNGSGGFAGDEIWRRRPDYPVLTTLPFDADRRTVFYGTSGGEAKGMGVDEDPNNPFSPLAKWQSAFTVPDSPNAIYASPIVAGAPAGADTTVLIPADSGYVYVRSSNSGGAVGVVSENSGTLNGRVRAGMAGFRGHVYVLTEGGDDSASPSLYSFEG